MRSNCCCRRRYLWPGMRIIPETFGSVAISANCDRREVMASTKLLRSAGYSADEQLALIDFVLALRKSRIQEFLKGVELSRSGTKEDLRERLQEALDRGDL